MQLDSPERAEIHALTWMKQLALQMEHPAWGASRRRVAVLKVWLVWQMSGGVKVQGAWVWWMAEVLKVQGAWGAQMA